MLNRYKNDFWQKICLVCGDKMKIQIIKKDLTSEEKIILEYRADVSGKPVKLNGRVNGYNVEMCLICKECGLALDSKQYLKVRAEQKCKKLVLSKDKLQENLLFFLYYGTKAIINTYYFLDDKSCFIRMTS